MTELHPVIYDLVPSVANAIHRRYNKHVEKDDIKQELIAWAMTRVEDHIIDLMEPIEERRRLNEQRSAWQMRRVAERYDRKGFLCFRTGLWKTLCIKPSQIRK